MKICIKCQQKNPSKVELCDIATGAMVWGVLVKCMYCDYSLKEAVNVTNEQKVCSKCNTENPGYVEIHDLASGKMIWEELQRCLQCSHKFERQEIIPEGLSDLDEIAKRLFTSEYEEDTKQRYKNDNQERKKGEHQLNRKEFLEDDFLVSLRLLWRKLIVATNKEDVVFALQKIEKEVNNLIHDLEPVEISWPRGTHALFVECPDSSVAARHIVSSLKVDGSTARMLATSRLPKVALYEKSFINVKHFAKKYLNQLNCQALPIKKDALEGIPNAYPCIRVMPKGYWVSSGALWLRPNLYSGTSIHLRSDKIVLIVSGEVEVQYYREIRRRKETEWKKNRTDRFSVIDLHSTQGIIRLCNHYTDLSMLPNFQSSASNINFKQYSDSLYELYPSSRIIQGYRAFPPELGLGSNPNKDTIISGWPQWEAYTRACRLLYRI
jgi:ribosomal protein L40E